MSEAAVGDPAPARTVGICIVRVESQSHSAPLVTVTAVLDIAQPPLMRRRSFHGRQSTLDEVADFLDKMGISG